MQAAIIPPRSFGQLFLQFGMAPYGDGQLDLGDVQQTVYRLADLFLAGVDYIEHPERLAWTRRTRRISERPGKTGADREAKRQDLLFGNTGALKDLGGRGVADQVAVAGSPVTDG